MAIKSPQWPETQPLCKGNKLIVTLTQAEAITNKAIHHQYKIKPPFRQGENKPETKCWAGKWVNLGHASCERKNMKWPNNSQISITRVLSAGVMESLPAQITLVFMWLLASFSYNIQHLTLTMNFSWHFNASSCSLESSLWEISTIQPK